MSFGASIRVTMKRYKWVEYNPGHEEHPCGEYVLWDDVQAEIQRYRALLLESKRSHYVCEDCWYSCPESGECCDEREKKCNCGASAWNAKVDEALASTS